MLALPLCMSASLEAQASKRLVLQHFEKTGGALDYMGVKIARTVSSQKLWAPGSAKQEYPGGWVTPGQYLVTVNTTRIHHQKTGVLTGQKRSGHQLMGVIVRRSLTDPGWTNHGFYDPPLMKPQNWGESKTITLKAGETLHVAYGNKIVDWQKRNGSDGIVVHCVASNPEPRGGLWGTGTANWSEAKWNLLKRRIREAAEYFTPNTSTYGFGPSSLPNPFPSDYANKASDKYDNRQAEQISRWLLNRAMKYIKNKGAWKQEKDELARLFEFFCNNTQPCFAWSDTPAEHYFYAHGLNYYPPYQINTYLDALPAAVFLDYDLSYEPLYKIITHLAQRADMTLSHAGSYTFGNHPYDGGLEKHKDDDDHTKWLWYTLGLRDMRARGSHRHKVWGPCVWARDLMGWPMTKAMKQCLWNSGNKVVPHGHEWTSQGAGAGFNKFYAQLEVEGAMFLWFTGTHTGSTFNRWARRHHLYKNGNSPHYYAKWCKQRFVDEPKGLKVQPGKEKQKDSYDLPTGVGVKGVEVTLTWTPLTTKPARYRVYRGTRPESLAPIGESKTASYLDTTAVKGRSYIYAVSAVDAQGNEGSQSDSVATKL